MKHEHFITKTNQPNQHKGNRAEEKKKTKKKNIK